MQSLNNPVPLLYWANPNDKSVKFDVSNIVFNIEGATAVHELSSKRESLCKLAA